MNEHFQVSANALEPKAARVRKCDMYQGLGELRLYIVVITRRQNVDLQL